MKDAVERITAKGNSVLLFQLANRIGYHTCNERETTKTNIIAMTRVGNKDEPMEDSEEEMSQALEEEKLHLIDSDEAFFVKDKKINVIHMNDRRCNDSDIVNWRLNAYPQLRELVVGDNCLKYVNGLQLRNMKKLEKVVNGE